MSGFAQESYYCLRKGRWEAGTSQRQAICKTVFFECCTELPGEGKVVWSLFSSSVSHTRITLRLKVPNMSFLFALKPVVEV